MVKIKFKSKKLILFIMERSSTSPVASGQQPESPTGHMPHAHTHWRDVLFASSPLDSLARHAPNQTVRLLHRCNDREDLEWERGHYGHRLVHHHHAATGRGRPTQPLSRDRPATACMRMNQRHGTAGRNHSRSYGMVSVYGVSSTRKGTCL